MPTNYIVWQTGLISYLGLYSLFESSSIYPYYTLTYFIQCYKKKEKYLLLAWFVLLGVMYFVTKLLSSPLPILIFQIEI